MNEIEQAIKEVSEVGLKNNDVTRFGDGYEKAIELVMEVLEKIKENIKTK